MDSPLHNLDDMPDEDGTAPAVDLASPISRALHLLDLVAAAGGPVRFADVQKSSPLPKATLSRLLRQLEAEGMLAFDPLSQRYRLGLRLIRLAHGAWQTASLVEVARPVIDRLAKAFETTVHLACLDHGQVLYLDKRVPRPTINMFSAPGRVGPAYCTGLGKAMLAFLPEESRRGAIGQQAFFPHTARTITSAEALEREFARIRARGYSLDDEEHETTVICVACPILAADGAVLGAISATSTTHVTTLADLAGRAGDLREGAAEIAREAETQILNR
jgi:IclR family KDG regulon transcriptional repressor